MTRHGGATTRRWPGLRNLAASPTWQRRQLEADENRHHSLRPGETETGSVPGKEHRRPGCPPSSQPMQAGQHGTGGCPGPFRSLLPPPAMAGPPGRSIPLSRRRTLGGWRRSRRWLRDFRDIPGNAPGLPVQDGHTLSGLFPRPAVGAVADSGFAQICAILHLPLKRDLRLSGQIWGDPHETRAAAHSASTVHPIHDVQPDHSG